MLDDSQRVGYNIESVKKNYRRRPLRLSRVFDPSPLYFVTFNTYNRVGFLARDEIHSAFVRFAQRAAGDFNIAVGRYVIMPDHIHLFVRGGADFSLGSWIGLLKQALARATKIDGAQRRGYNQKASSSCSHRPVGGFPIDGSRSHGYDCELARGTGQIWQEGFFDHVLRTDESYSQKWNYVLENPVRARLVRSPEEWPYQGEIVYIDRA